MKKIHFIGIGGISMSALAKLCVAQGFLVTGTDDIQNENFNNLKNLGIKVSLKQDFESVKQADVIVYTIAVKNHIELQFAKQLNKVILERAEFLAKISQSYKHTIAVAGTHGKTTTTALLGHIFCLAGLNPTVHLGGVAPDLGGNLKIGDNDIFITEACEFNKSFLHLRPEYSIITNIECDHMDTFCDFNDLQSSFLLFAENTREKVVLCAENLSNIELFNSDKFLHYGLDIKNNLYAKVLTQDGGKYCFEVYKNNDCLGEFKNGVLGKHNILNVLACIAISLEFGVPLEVIKSGVSTFKGVDRRLTKLMSKGGVTHYLDYAHHPTEIKATLDTIKSMTKGRVIAIFQPHTYSRTLALMNEFRTCFDLCDYLFLLPTYSAREQYIAGGDVMDLFYNLNGRLDCCLVSSLCSLSYELKKMLKAGDFCVWLGAGDIDLFAKTILNEQ